MKGLPIFWTRMAVELIPMSLYTHTLRVLPIHFGRETVPSGTVGAYSVCRRLRWDKCGRARITKVLQRFTLGCLRHDVHDYS